MGRQSTVSSPADPELSLVEALRRGDEAAFNELFGRYDRSLRRLARAYVGDQAAAEDVAQETWLGVINGIDRFDGRSSVKTWLFRILINRAKTRGVRDARTVPFTASADLETTRGVSPAEFVPADQRGAGHWATPVQDWRGDPELRSESAFLRAVLERAIDSLPERQRVVVLLRDVHGLSAEEACELLDLSETNQRVLLHRGRNRVRAAVGAALGEGERA